MADLDANTSLKANYIAPSRERQIFAPVLIPTLCRYDKFKACVESLAKNTNADQTDLFIALDYPLKPEHWDGFNKINKYVDSLIGFKSVVVIRREVNYGANANIFYATEEIFSSYDCMIFSEDDNIFSPNFLEFINNGLELFKDDKSIFAICGYRHYYNIRFDKNNYFFQNADMSAWGYGIWRDRYLEIATKGTVMYFKKKLLNPKHIFSVWRRGGNQLVTFFTVAKRNRDTNKIRTFTDGMISVYMYLNKMYCVMPTVSKVRNMGFDGSGNSTFISNEIMQKHNSQKIDSDNEFEFKGEDNYIDYNRKIYRDENYGYLPFYTVIYIAIRKILRFIHR